ncbi:MAG: hypothetical protein J6A70_04575 [Prevotella sp.]|nr:hypothetical protein [Prevotella sp.]
MLTQYYSARQLISHRCRTHKNHTDRGWLTKNVGDRNHCHALRENKAATLKGAIHHIRAAATSASVRNKA